MTFLFLACSDYDFEDQTRGFGNVDEVPIITFDPEEVVFDPLSPGESAVTVVTVSNTGGADLHVEGILLSGSTAFSAPLVTDLVLAPLEGHLLEVAFSPSAREHSGEIIAYSDDPERSEATLPLSGSGLVPELLIYPDPYDFGEVVVGCPAEAGISLYNQGLAPLTVTSVTPVGAITTDFEDAVTVAPGEEIVVTVGFSPVDDETTEMELWVGSDDPRGPQSAALTGRGNLTGAGEDHFIQSDGPWERADVLVYVDQSGSMEDDQSNLATNFSLFADALAAVELDWQLIVATADDGCHNVGVIDAATSDIEDTVLRAVQGAGGTWTEAGLTITRNALQEADGGCNDGFLREDSKTAVILVSDEPEQSRSSWSTLVAEIEAAAPTAALHAVVGDVPGGCRTADPGTGYQEAAVATGGAMLSICEPDWGSYFEVIAELSALGRTGTFALSSYPDPASLHVEVSGVESTAWTYDTALNAIVFVEGAWPEPRSSIDITYALDSSCDR